MNMMNCTGSGAMDFDDADMYFYGRTICFYSGVLSFDEHCAVLVCYKFVKFM